MGDQPRPAREQKIAALLLTTETLLAEEVLHHPARPDPSELAAGLHMGYVDTDMTAAVTSRKENPADIAKAALDGIEAGAFEVLADETSRQTKAALSGDITNLYPQLTA